MKDAAHISCSSPPPRLELKDGSVIKLIEAEGGSNSLEAYVAYRAEGPIVEKPGFPPELMAFLAEFLKTGFGWKETAESLTVDAMTIRTSGTFMCQRKLE